MAGGYPYVWAEQQYGDPSRAFAKYLFTYHETAEQWRTWSEWGDHFVSDVIEPVYFRLANDISWNIYWISVLKEEELKKVDPRQRIAFTSNTEYTRNLLLSLEHLSDAIPIGRITVDTMQEELQQPGDIWLKQLEDKAWAFAWTSMRKGNWMPIWPENRKNRRLQFLQAMTWLVNALLRYVLFSFLKDTAPTATKKLEYSVPKGQSALWVQRFWKNLSALSNRVGFDGRG